MKATLIIAITLLMNGAEVLPLEGGDFIDYELRISQKDMSVCEEAKSDIRGKIYTNNAEYGDEYGFQIRRAWCVDNEGLLELPPLDK